MAGAFSALASVVPAPRQVLAGETYLITRRTAQRAFRLRPSAETNQMCLYSLALAASKTGMEIHAVGVMSNHHHLVVTDVQGLMPIFLREFHRVVAKGLNKAQGQRENFWSSTPPSVLRLVDREDVLQKIAYVVANPVTAGLVETPEEWPGINLWGAAKLEIVRPTVYFGRRSKSPQSLTLIITPPSFARGRSDWDGRLSAAIGGAVAMARQKLVRQGRRTLGRVAVLTCSVLERAISEEPKRDGVPKMVAQNGDARMAARRAHRQFQASYRTGLDRWRSGDRSVVFPDGTWWMSVHHGARVAPPLRVAVARVDDVRRSDDLRLHFQVPIGVDQGG